MSIAVPTVTGYSAFWQNVSNINGEVGVPYAMRFSRSSHERRASIALSRSGFRAVRELMVTLNGVAPGSAALDTYAQASASQQGPTVTGPGGVRTIDTITTVNRNTAASDVTTLNARVVDGLFVQAPSSYPTDASGNGGGGKVRF
jgi:hypothetical protein